MKTQITGFNVGYALASSSLLAALIYFFASNWGALERWQKLTPMAALVAVLYGLYVYLSVRPNREFLSRLFILCCCIAFGIGLALVGQIYNSHADNYVLFLIWFIAAAAFAIVVRWQPFYVLAYVLAHLTYWLALFPTDSFNDYSEGTIVLIMTAMAVLNGLLYAYIASGRFPSPSLAFLSYTAAIGTAIVLSNSFVFEAYYGLFDVVAAILLVGSTLLFIRRGSQTYLLWNGLFAAAFLIMKYIELLLHFEGAEAFFITGLPAVALFVWGGAAWIRYVKTVTPADADAGSAPETGAATGPDEAQRRSKARLMAARALSVAVVGAGTVIGAITLVGFVLLVFQFEKPQYVLTGFGLLASLGMLAARKFNSVVRYTLLAVGLCVGVGTAAVVDWTWLLPVYAAIAVALFAVGAGRAERLLWFAASAAIAGLFLGIMLDDWTVALGALTAIMAVVFGLGLLLRDRPIGAAMRECGYYGFLTVFFIFTFAAGHYAYDGLYFLVLLACIARTHRTGDSRAFRITVAYWSLFVLWKYYDTAWELLHKSWSLALFGFVLLAATYVLERRHLRRVGRGEAPVRSRRELLWVTAVVLAELLVLGAQIGRSETILARGETVILELLPRDPRSMLQGDYVELRYSAAEPPQSLGLDDKLYSGDKVAVVLARSASGAHEFKQLYDDDYALQPGEAVINGKWRWNGIEFGIEHYFVPEGTGGETEQTAKYAEVKVARNGNALLVRLLPGLPGQG